MKMRRKRSKLLYLATLSMYKCIFQHGKPERLTSKRARQMDGFQSPGKYL